MTLSVHCEYTLKHASMFDSSDAVCIKQCGCKNPKNIHFGPIHSEKEQV